MIAVTGLWRLHLQGWVASSFVPAQTVFLLFYGQIMCISPAQVGPRGRDHIFRDRLPHMWRFTKCEAVDRRPNGQRDGRRRYVCVAFFSCYGM